MALKIGVKGAGGLSFFFFVVVVAVLLQINCNGGGLS